MNENQEHRYSLSSNKAKKIKCPYCQKPKHWQRYIDNETGELLPDSMGRCDNENKCGAWVTPKETGYALDVWKQENQNNYTAEKKYSTYTTTKQTKSIPVKPLVYFDKEIYSKVSNPSRYINNIFLQNLINNIPYPFPREDVYKVASLYQLGTINKGYRAGAVTFPIIDMNGNIRAVQVKQFDETNHTTGTGFLHSIIESSHNEKGEPLPEWLQSYIAQEKRVTALFGEHLIGKYPHHIVAIVEAPKTAIIGSLYFGLPYQSNMVWVATFGKSYFTIDRLQSLKNRKVFVFPDLSKDGATFREWKEKSEQFEKQLQGSRFAVSDLLENHAEDEDRQNGNDIADVIIKQDWKDRKQSKEDTPILKEIHELLFYFSKLDYEDYKVRFNPIMTVHMIKQYVEIISTYPFAKANNDTIRQLNKLKIYLN